MSFQTRRARDGSSVARQAMLYPNRIAVLLEQVQSARVRADQLGLKTSEVALRRAVIALSKELGLPSGLNSREHLFTD